MNSITTTLYAAVISALIAISSAQLQSVVDGDTILDDVAGAINALL